MEALSLLEKKISDLLELIKKLKTENSDLKEDNKKLNEKIDSLETVILKDKEELEQEKELTKLVVDGLISSIDSLKCESK